MTESVLRQSGKRIATMFLLSDGANNEGPPPLDAARRLRGQQVPVVTVGFGSEAAGAGSRDIAMRELITSPTVFVKNKLQVRGSLSRPGLRQPAARRRAATSRGRPPRSPQTQVKAPEGQQVVPFSGPEVHRRRRRARSGSRSGSSPRTGSWSRPTTRSAPTSRVLSGGLSVLLHPGAELPLGVQVHRRGHRQVARHPGRHEDHPPEAQGDRGELSDDEFAPGRYDVYILGDLPARFLTRQQHRLLTEAVEKGAGLIMLGGHSSFGAGGWASTELARVLPVDIHPGDGQLEPEAGVKFVPMPTALDGYLLQVGANRRRQPEDLGRAAAPLGDQPIRPAQARREHPRRGAGAPAASRS